MNTTTLAQHLSAAATSLVVASATGFAAGRLLVCGEEIMQITSVDGVVIGVFRGYNGTPAQPHGAGLSITCALPNELRPDLGAMPGTAAGLEFSEVIKGNVHISTVALKDVTLISPAGGADLAAGVLLGTLPPGKIIVRSVALDLSLANTTGNSAADTPDLGIGTTVAAGAVATLNLVAGAENILTGQTINDCAGTQEILTSEVDVAIEAAAAHTVYLNIADGWAANGDVIKANGTVKLEWIRL